MKKFFFTCYMFIFFKSIISKCYTGSFDDNKDDCLSRSLDDFEKKEIEEGFGIPDTCCYFKTTVKKSSVGFCRGAVKDKAEQYKSKDGDATNTVECHTLYLKNIKYLLISLLLFLI